MLTICFFPKHKPLITKRLYGGRKEETEGKRGREIKKGSLANELLKDNLHMSGKIKRGRQKRRAQGELNLLE